MVTNVQMTQVKSEFIHHRCPQCQGRGRQITKACPLCHSNKLIETQHTLAVHIPAGAPEGYEEIFHGEADEGVDHEPGDVSVRVRSRRTEGDGMWSRKEAGIIGRVTLSVAEVCIRTQG
jgi:DnaJ-related protein SCJ1